jgi:hypothetical protein
MSRDASGLGLPIGIDSLDGVLRLESEQAGEYPAIGGRHRMLEGVAPDAPARIGSDPAPFAPGGAAPAHRRRKTSRPRAGAAEREYGRAGQAAARGTWTGSEADHFADGGARIIVTTAVLHSPWLFL